MENTDEHLITATEQFVKGSLKQADGSHDWQHIIRVRNLAERIGKEEGANMLIVTLGALLHDIADHKYHNGDKEIGPNTARAFLAGLDVSTNVIEAVAEIITNISFSGPRGKERMQTMEGSVVRDADRLEALGAIGIARAFTYGGSKGSALYDPAVPPSSNGTKTTPIINHFHEKLFALKDLMETSAGRRVAEERHVFMVDFLKRFWQECEGAA